MFDLCCVHNSIYAGVQAHQSNIVFHTRRDYWSHVTSNENASWILCSFTYIINNNICCAVPYFTTHDFENSQVAQTSIWQTSDSIFKSRNPTIATGVLVEHFGFLHIVQYLLNMHLFILWSKVIYTLNSIWNYLNGTFRN